MKRIIVVSVNFPQTFKIEIDDVEDIDVIRERIKNYANYLVGSGQTGPIITWSDFERVVG